jgi:hypothetical protein
MQTDDLSREAPLPRVCGRIEATNVHVVNDLTKTSIEFQHSIATLGVVPPLKIITRIREM